MPADPLPLLQIMQAKGIGPRSLARILDRLNQDRVSLREFLRLEPETVAATYQLSEDQTRSIHAAERQAVQLAERLVEREIKTVLQNSPEYPQRLSTVLGAQAPPALFVSGRLDLLGRRGVGFCGARHASEEGIRCAAAVARALADLGLVVVSGHAAGVDEAAHRGALEGGGSTGLVLPEGILRFRPRVSISRLLNESNSIVVSEFPPNLSWSVQNAMQRNRTICGLVHAMIVIEAGTSGGTWEAGLSSLKLGLPLFVLDYSRPAPTAEGNALLLQRGAQPLPTDPGKAPDLSLLLQALELPLKRGKPTHQPTLFDSLPVES